MSETETYIGRLSKITTSPEDYAKGIILSRNPQHKKEWSTWVEELQELDGYEKWHLINGILYFSDHKSFRDEGFSIAKELPNGDIEYAVQFYDGGCDFSEAVESAVKNLKK